MEFYSSKRVLVTGGTGFIGGHLVRDLLRQEAFVRVVTHQQKLPPAEGVELLQADLRTAEGCAAAVRGIDTVFHLAAFGWGIGANTGKNAELFTNNVLIHTQMLEAAHRAEIERYLLASSTSVYPAASARQEEDEPWSSEPHPGELTFGWSKRMAEIQARAYAAQYGMKIAIVRPGNPYGPGDTFDLGTSHVIPALICKAVERQNPFLVWGSGKAVRGFVHVKDVARGMLLALEKYVVCDPLNLASDEPTSICELVQTILTLTGYTEAHVVFDPSKPEGSPYKVPSIRKAAEKIGWRPEISLREGLAETIRWFLENRHV